MIQLRKQRHDWHESRGRREESRSHEGAHAAASESRGEEALRAHEKGGHDE